MSASQSTFGLGGRKRRSTRSSATLTPWTRIVVRARLRGASPEIAAARISRSTRLRETADAVPNAQLGVDPRGAIDAPAGRVDPFDLVGQPGVLERPICRWPALPGIERGAVHSEHAAHDGDGIVGLLRSDKREQLAYRSSVSLAKKAAAFFRISRSIRSVWFSRRRRASSSRSSLLSPPRRSPASAAACLTQLRNDTSEIPRSLAAWRIDLPVRRTSSIASRLNSSGYGGLVLGT